MLKSLFQTMSAFSTALHLLPLTITPIVASLSIKELSPLSNLGQKDPLDLSTNPSFDLASDPISDPAICSSGLYSSSDTLLYTIPYPYSTVISVISDFANLDYTPGPPPNIRLNGSNNLVGTARFYTNSALPSAQLVETLTTYSKSPFGPFQQVITVEPYTVTAPPSSRDGKVVNVTMYSNYDATTAIPICHGLATQLNYTIQFCATDLELAAEISHRGHMSMADGVNRLLGNRNFSSCMQLQAEGGGDTLGYPGWGHGLFMGVGNSSSGEGAWWSGCFGIIIACSILVVMGGGVFNY